MHLTSIALAGLLAAAAVPVSGQERRQWIAGEGPEGASLIYGTPQSDDVLLRFSCDAATKELTVAFAFEPLGAAEGMQIDMELFSEGGTAVLNATGHRMLLDDGFVLEATTRLEPELRQILTEGDTLSIMVQDGVEEIPLTGAAKDAAALLEQCG